MCGTQLNGLRLQELDLLKVINFYNCHSVCHLIPVVEIKDLKKLMVSTWSNSSIAFPQPKGYDHLKSIFKMWLATACNQNPAKITECLQSR